MSTRSKFSCWKRMFPAKLTVKLTALLTLVIVHTEGYYRCCGSLCYKQCNKTNCLCTNNVKCTKNDECANIDTCSTPCSLSAISCPDTLLKCFGTFCWKQCEEGNSWCTNYEGVTCLRDSQCSPFNCTSQCTSLNPYDCTQTDSYLGVTFRCKEGYCYRQCQGRSKWCTSFSFCKGNGTCDPFAKCQTTCAAL